MSGIRDSGFEIRRTSESRIPSLQFLLLLAAVALVFLAVRIALLFARQAFFDELYTVWMARQPVENVIPNLLQDSGPPLYYWLARFDSVRELRWVSLVFASVQFVIVVFFARSAFPLAPHPRFAHPLPPGEGQNSHGAGENLELPSPLPAGEGGRRPGEGRSTALGLLAAALLAVYPPAVLFAVDGRAYALCALFVTIGVLAMAAERPFAAAGAFVLAAYSHYYGVLFFPLLLTGVVADARAGVFHHKDTKDTKAAQRPWRLRVLALIAAMVAFIPGFILALQQPPQATGWNRELLFAPVLNLSWTGVYPESLFVAAPVLLAVVAMLILVAALSRSWSFAPAVLVPLILVVAFHVAGRPVYFPMRFECVIAGPLALWAASSLSTMRPFPRFSIAGSLVVLGLSSTLIAAMSHRIRPPDPYRAAATELSTHADRQSMIVATGYCYLETVVALDRPVIAWPAEQALHPGWRAQVAGGVRDLPAGGFLWVGERQSAEVAKLRGARRVQLLFLNERAVIARVEHLTPPLH